MAAKHLPPRREQRAKERREAALKRGADELMNLVEYVLQNRPRVRKRARAVA